MFKRSVLTALLGSAACGTALGQLHAGDILLVKNAAGSRILTGQVNAQTAEPEYNVRVFAAAFADAPNFTNNPGLDSDIGVFAPGSQIGFTIRKALRLWDGSAFTDIPAERIQVKFGPLGPVLSPTDDTPVVGFSMSVASNGQFHHHPGFTLLSPAEDGVYLMELEVWSTEAGLEASRPYWMVFNQNRPQNEEDDALAWARDYLVGCPSDFDQNHFVNGDDFDQFVVAFEAGDIGADFDMNGFVNGDDFDQFIVAFVNGC